MQGDDQVRFVSRSPWSGSLLLRGFGLYDLGRHDFVNNGDARSNQMRELGWPDESDVRPDRLTT